jgi:hypothetical protein
VALSGPTTPFPNLMLNMLPIANDPERDDKQPWIESP